MSVKIKKQKQDAENAILLARQEEEERKRYRLERLQEIKKEEDEFLMKNELQVKEHDKRLAVVSNHIRIFEKIKSEYIYDKMKKREMEEWNQFLVCDRLPYPEEPSSMNTHLSYWSSLKENEYLDSVLEWAEKFIVLLSKIKIIIEEPLGSSQKIIANLKEVRQSYRTEIFRKFDQATFHILRQIQTKMRRIDYWTVDFERNTQNIKICMWAWLEFPLSALTKRNPPSVDFPRIGITIKLPVPYDRKFVVIRVIQILSDPFSDSARSWEQPSRPTEGNILDVASICYTKNVEAERAIWRKKAKKFAHEKKHLDAGSDEVNKSLEILAMVTKPGSEGMTIPDSLDKINVEDDKDKLQKISEDEQKEQVRPSLETQKNLQAKIGSKERQTLKDIWKVDIDTIYFDYDIKEDFLDCLCAIEDIAKKKTNIIPLRRLILNGDPNKVSITLASLKMINGNFKEYILKYFGKNQSLDIAELVGDISEMLVSEDTRENTVMKELRKCMAINTSKNEINLRKYVIMGGVFCLDLVKQVEQKFPLKDGSYIQIHYGKHELKKDNFFFIYVAPKIEESNENEDKPPPDDDIDKLINIEISLTKKILWFEAPTPILWHDDEKIWSNQHVYDTKYNEEKQMISFKIGRSLPIGLASLRYYNLPFQTWEIRPGPPLSNTVYFSLTTSTVILEFIIQNNKIAISKVQNAPSTIMKPFYEKFFEQNEFVKFMKEKGLDIFPDDDAFLYIEGHSLKDFVVEEHVYMSMAIFSPFFQFSWSRWNMLAGWEKLVFQARQAYSRKELPNYCMIMTNLFRSTIVACSEVSPAFTDESIPNIGFHADLYSLLKNICSNKIKQLITKTETDLINAVFFMIMRTKILSYS